jgi:hypothetical protein
MLPTIAVEPIRAEAGIGRMSSAQRQYLLVEQGVGAAIFNFIVNGAIAWLVFRAHPVVPLWGEQSIAGDTIATCFLLSLITALIVTALARGRLGSGKLDPLGWTASTHPRLRLVPRGTITRGLVLGVASMLTVAPLTIAVLWALGVQAMSLRTFVLFKATFAALLAAIVTPLIALWAITPATTCR